ncbi:claudin-8-like [Syngnathoides biaculeatus]|uniref:claudin-8-like n=1 Tax=Syngnathoides biaculeatus TaxID=300417 RepID=UPI002ADE0F39|nr:claudin-8-like [Syngnathoides biaculeatus]
MVAGICELAAVCVGLVGLIGAAATTGMPTWKVTAFIGENIVVMETRWEGLWMNCYRQANIRMQCKVYDSLLFLPAELQAARGLMCCSLALSGLGLLVAAPGLRCTSCLRGNDRAKAAILAAAGGMQLLASVCVFIPVSWTGHVIIRDFYNPLLIDAQRRELGDALYIGWVTGAFLFSSGLLFICGLRMSNRRSLDIYHPAGLTKPLPMSYQQPVRSVSTLTPNGFWQSSTGQHLRATSDAVVLDTPENTSLLYQASRAPHSSLRNSNPTASIYTPVNSLYMSQNSTPYTLTYNPTVSYQPGFRLTPQTPLFIPYKTSIMEPPSHSGSSPGVYI